MTARADRLQRPARGRLLALASVFVVAFATGAATQLTGPLEGMERESLRARFDLRGEERPRDIAVVAVDARSFDRLGVQWPFPRSLHGRAIDALRRAGAREIVYDVQFTEPTRVREDLALYRAIGRAGGAVLATSESDGRGRTNVLGGDENLARVGARAAASDLLNDAGGAITRLPREVNGLETMAVVAARRASGPRLSPDRFEDGGALIDFRGPPGTIPTFSFVDVIQGRVDPSAFRDRVVVVGAAAPTLRDVHTTLVGGGALMSGAEVQANAIWSALHGLPLREAPPALGLLLVALLALVAPLVALRAGAYLAGLSTLFVGVPFLILAQLLFMRGLLIEVVPPLVALAMGAVGTLLWSEVGERRARRALSRDNEVLESAVRERTRALRETQLEVATRLGAAVESRDGDTGQHIERLAHFCERLGLAAGMSAGEAEMLRHASTLHDVGKVGIPDRILLKSGPLDADEWEIMKGHTRTGGEILAGSSSELIRMGATIALAHHERWDGSGYPLGLQEEEIPLPARICAVCDVFDALLSTRPYKAAWPLEDVLAELRTRRGTHLDPQMVDLFLPLAPSLESEWFVSGDQERAPA